METPNVESRLPISDAAQAVNELLENVETVRDRVNQRRTHARLFADRRRFTKACSAMDMLSDTCQALKAYVRICSKGADTATSYLVVFGALQVLYVQQDAAYWLCRSVEHPNHFVTYSGPEKWVHSPGFEALAAVRDLRNSSIGHPVSRDKGPLNERGSYFIVQMSLRATGFQMTARNEDGGTNWVNVPVLKLVAMQGEALSSILRATVQSMDEAERSHLDKFSNDTLEGVFHSVSYRVEKLHDAVRDSSFRPMGTHSVEAVRHAMTEFRGALEKREEPFSADLDYIYKQLESALTRLADYYERRSEDADLADLLTTFVADRIEDLRSWAEEMDSEYRQEQT